MMNTEKGIDKHAKAARAIFPYAAVLYRIAFPERLHGANVVSAAGGKPVAARHCGNSGGYHAGGA